MKKVQPQQGKRQTKRHTEYKLCLVCKRPFSWRKKWARDWSKVKYCSKRCAGQRNVLKTQEAI